MKSSDIKNKKVDAIGSANAVSKFACVRLIDAIKYLPEKYKDYYIECMNMEYHSEEQKEAKNNSPRFYIAGTFKTNTYDNGTVYKCFSDNAVVEYNNLITVDVDAKDNADKDIEEIRKQLFDLPYVFSCLKSFSGKGFYCIIPVEDGKCAKDYYKYIAKLWKQQYDINVDSQACNVARARVFSYDEDIDKWIKPNDTDIQVWKLKYVEPIKEMVKPKVTKVNNQDDAWLLKVAQYAVDNGCSRNYSVANGYSVWYYDGCACAYFGENGRSIFLQLSRNSSGYTNDNDSNRKFNESLKKPGTYDDAAKLFCGLMKNRYGTEWWKQIKGN